MKSRKNTGSFSGKGYYIALILCAAAIGISGYVYHQNENKAEEVTLLDHETTVPAETVWTEDVEAGLKKNGLKQVSIPTVFTTAPAVKKAFDKTEYAKRLADTGVVLSYICPLMYMNNPLCGKMPVITCSNKLRTYSTARYYTEQEILGIITEGGK